MQLTFGLNYKLDKCLIFVFSLSQKMLLFSIKDISKAMIVLNTPLNFKIITTHSHIYFNLYIKI